MKKPIFMSLVFGVILFSGCSQIDSENKITERKKTDDIQIQEIEFNENGVTNSISNNLNTTSPIDTSDWQIDKYAALPIRYPLNWYFYSFDGGARSLMYFTDGGNYIKNTTEETEESLYIREHKNFENECLISVDVSIGSPTYQREKINTKKNDKEKEKCDLILNELEKQIPEKNIRGSERFEKEQKITNTLRNYILLDNCGNYYKDEKEKKIFYVKEVMGDREILNIAEADYQSFAIVADCIVAKDKNYVYLGANVVKNADSKTIKHIPTNDDPYLFEDKNFRYKCYESCEVIGKKG